MIICAECEKVLEKVPSWYSTVNIRFVCDACRKVNPQHWLPATLDEPEEEKPLGDKERRDEYAHSGLASGVVGNDLRVFSIMGRAKLRGRYRRMRVGRLPARWHHRWLGCLLVRAGRRLVAGRGYPVEPLVQQKDAREICSANHD
jgi:hypothetical protein